MTSPTVALLAPICAFMSSVTWAIGSSVYSKLSREHSAFAVNFTRAAVALPLFLMLWFFVYQTGIARPLAIEPRHIAWLFVSMVSSYAIGDALFLRASQVIGIPTALAIASMYPLWTTLGGWIVLGETPSLRSILGLVIALVGITIVIVSAPRTNPNPHGSSQSTPRLSRGLIYGILLAVGTSLFWGLNIFAIARVGKDLDPSPLNAIRMTIALFLTFFLGRLATPNQSVAVPWRSLRPVAWVFALEAFGGSLVYAYGIARTPLMLGAILSSLSPVLSVPVAWALKLEKPSVLRTFGVILTVCGLTIMLS